MYIVSTLKKSPFMVCEDDTALNPHIDVKVYLKADKRKIEIYGF